MLRCCLTSSSASSAAIKAFVEELISTNRVQIFSKTTCPYCSKAKAALSSVGVKFNVTELNQLSNGGDIQSELRNLSGRTTVPQVFIGGKFFGGGDDTMAGQKSGTLVARLREANADFSKL